MEITRLCTCLCFALLLVACSDVRTISAEDAGQIDASGLSDRSDLADTPAPPDAGTLPDHPVYKDETYAQEFHRNYTAEKDGLFSNDVRAIAVDQNSTVWAGTAGGVMYFENGLWKDSGLHESIVGLTARSKDDLWAATQNAIFTIDGKWTKVADVQGITAISENSDGIWVGESNGVGIATKDGYQLKLPFQQPINDLIESNVHVLSLATNDGIYHFDANLNPVGHVTTVDGLPSNEVRSLALSMAGDLDPSQVLVAGTAGGLYSSGEGSDFGEPYDDITSVWVRNQPYGTAYLLIATTIGAARTLKNGLGWHYYHARYWLPDDDVRDVVMTQTDEVFFATAGGIGHVWAEQKSLADKAAHYDELNQARHVRLGYTTGCYLPNAGDTSTWVNGDDDNDGQWTGMYLASQTFRYAATGDPRALANAKVAMTAMLKLESVTGIPGFFARSIVPGADCPAKQQGGGEWHLSNDGLWCWKGNTSTDEFVGHMFGLSLYYDLAADETEKALIAADVSRILTRIIDHGYIIADVDGLCTTDGHFDPNFMKTIGVYGDAGLNSAMILGGLRAGYHMTKDQKFADAFKELTGTYRYHEYVRNALEISQTVQINHDSHEMMGLAFFTLVRLETDPKYMKIWIQGLEQWWQSQRPEKNPEFNMIYAALTGGDGDLDVSIATLKQIFWDLVVWGCRNSQRKDITIDKKPDRFGRQQSTEVIRYDERYVMKWNENPYNLDEDATGSSEESATFWLLPYWMGRYYGYISPPKR